MLLLLQMVLYLLIALVVAGIVVFIKKNRSFLILIWRFRFFRSEGSAVYEQRGDLTIALPFCQIFDSIQGFFFGIVMGGQKKIIFFIAEIHGDPSSGLFIYHTSDQKNMQ